MASEITRIIQISSSATEEGHEIFGLGENNLVYIWSWIKGSWILYSKDN